MAAFSLDCGRHFCPSEHDCVDRRNICLFGCLEMHKDDKPHLGVRLQTYAHLFRRDTFLIYKLHMIWLEMIRSF